MTDEEILYKYLNRDFYIDVGHNGFIYVDRTTGVIYNFNEFSMHISSMFGVEFSPLHREWVNKTKKYYAKEINEFLSECSVKLTHVGWSVCNKSGVEISMDSMVDILSSLGHDVSKIRLICEEWFINKTIEATEKAMNFR